MARSARPLFRRFNRETGEPQIYIAVRSISTGTDSSIQPGEDVNLRPHQLRSLYQRRRIGPKGHPWTEQALASKGFPLGFVSDGKKPDDKIQLPEPIKDNRPWAVVGTDERFRTKKEAEVWAEKEYAEIEDQPAIKKDGLVWTVPERPDRFKKKSDAVKWIKKNYVKTEPKGEG